MNETLQAGSRHIFIFDFPDHGIIAGGSETAGRPPEVGGSRIQETRLYCGGKGDDLLSY